MEGDTLCSILGQKPAATPVEIGVWHLRDKMRANSRAAQTRLDWLIEGANRRLEGYSAGYSAWSGGKDSTVSSWLADLMYPGIPVVSFICGLEFPETLQYQRDVAERMGWNWHTIQTGDGLQVLADSGLWDHDKANDDTVDSLFDVAIRQPAAAAHEQFGPHLVWGIRADESRARRFMTRSYGRDGTLHRKDGTTTIAPLTDWTSADVIAAHTRMGVGPNPLYATLADMGVPLDQRRVDIMVGANGIERGRLAVLRQGWPREWARLCASLPRLHEFG